MTDQSIEAWPGELERAIASSGGMFQRVTVLRETDSTQDAARRMGALAGEVIVAWRQTAGRGRLGRKWHDTGEHGVAMTCVIPRAQPERLATASAVGVVQALDEALGCSVSIKWPNDIVVGGRKLAGILIEQTGDCALVGIGVNVRTPVWPIDLSRIAVSIEDLGPIVDRLQVMTGLLTHLPRAWRLPVEALVPEFARRDGLSGARAEFRCGERMVRGVVQAVDPMRGLSIRTPEGEDLWLPAATTSVLPSLGKVFERRPDIQ